MGGPGSGRTPNFVNRIIENKTSPAVLFPNTAPIVLPNHSGDHSAGKVFDTPVDDFDIVNKKYVDDSTGATLTDKSVPYSDGTTFVEDNANFNYNDTTKELTVGEHILVGNTAIGEVKVNNDSSSAELRLQSQNDAYTRGGGAKFYGGEHSSFPGWIVFQAGNFNGASDPESKIQFQYSYNTITTIAEFNKDFELDMLTHDIVGVGTINTGAANLTGNLDVDGTASFAGNITASGSLTLESTGSVVVDLKADSDNATESDLPYIRFFSDGGQDRGGIGVTGVADQAPDGSVLTGAIANALTIWGNDSVQIMADSNDTIYMEAGDLRFTTSDDIIFDCGDYLYLKSASDTTVECTSGNVYYNTVNAYDHVFSTNGSEKFRIHDAGYFKFANNGGLQYGEISAVDNSTQTTIAAAGTPVQVTIFDTNGISNGNVTPDHTNDHITVGDAGDYEIHVSATVNSIAGAASRMELTVKKNNGASEIIPHINRNLAGGGGESGVISMSGLATLAANDTIEVWIENETNTQNYVVEDISLCLKQIGS